MNLEFRNPRKTRWIPECISTICLNKGMSWKYPVLPSLNGVSANCVYELPRYYIRSAFCKAFCFPVQILQAIPIVSQLSRGRKKESLTPLRYILFNEAVNWYPRDQKKITSYNARKISPRGSKSLKHDLGNCVVSFLTGSLSTIQDRKEEKTTGASQRR